MKKILTSLFVALVFCFMSGAVLACGPDCDCGCQQGEKCTCKKEAKCDCGCEEGKCNCKKCKCKKCKCAETKCDCGCEEGKCTCRKSKKFKFFRKKQIKCNCEQ